MRRVKYTIACFFVILGVETGYCSLSADTLRILFTHDLHASLLGAKQYTPEGTILHRGGFAPLATLIERERSAVRTTLLVDGGDFSMGSFSQILFSTHAPEYVAMAQMGYDALCPGNHEFDFGLEALYRMRQTGDSMASAKGYAPPCWLLANLKPFPAKEWVMIERNGQRIGLFGLLGRNALENAPDAHSLVYEDPVRAARAAVQALQAAGADWIICLSHSGTDERPKKSEDEVLARKVPGIDLIISAHSHTVFTTPKSAGSALIVSAGAFSQYLGVIDLVKKEGKAEYIDYRLLPVNDQVPAQAALRVYIDSLQTQIDARLRAQMHICSGDTVAQLNRYFAAAPDNREISVLGCLVADAYCKAAGAQVGIVPLGSLRAGLFPGALFPADIFAVLPLGLGADGNPGGPVLKAWLSGAELIDLCELNASIAPFLPDARLFFSGLKYEYNPLRIPFTRVTKVWIEENTGQWTRVDKQRLYPVTAGLYTVQMLGLLRSSSHGLLSAAPKTREGVSIDPAACILYEDVSEDGAGRRELKEWVVFMSYIAENEEIIYSTADRFSFNVIRRASVLPIVLYAFAIFFVSLSVYLVIRRFRQLSKKRL